MLSPARTPRTLNAVGDSGDGDGGYSTPPRPPPPKICNAFSSERKPTNQSAESVATTPVGATGGRDNDPGVAVDGVGTDEEKERGGKVAATSNVQKTERGDDFVVLDPRTRGRQRQRQRQRQRGAPREGEEAGGRGGGGGGGPWVHSARGRHRQRTSEAHREGEGGGRGSWVECGDVRGMSRQGDQGEEEKQEEAGGAGVCMSREAKNGMGSKWTLKTLQKRLAGMGVDVPTLWGEIHDVVIKTLIAIEAQVTIQI